MILDQQNQVSDAQALTATAVATNVIDLGVAGNDPFGGEPMGFAITVDVAADHTTGNETYEVDINCSASADLSTPTTIIKRVIDYSLLTAGSKHFIPLSDTILLRYLGLNYVLGGTTPTITVTAELIPQAAFDYWKPLASNSSF